MVSSTPEFFFKTTTKHVSTDIVEKTSSCIFITEYCNKIQYLHMAAVDGGVCVGEGVVVCVEGLGVSKLVNVDADVVVRISVEVEVSEGVVSEVGEAVEGRVGGGEAVWGVEVAVSEGVVIGVAVVDGVMVGVDVGDDVVVVWLAVDRM